METANNVFERKGISRLQAHILEILAKQDRHVASSVILAALTDAPTASQRVSVSRSLRRLIERGNVVAFYATEVNRPGRGYLYALRKE